MFIYYFHYYYILSYLFFFLSFYSFIHFSDGALFLRMGHSLCYTLFFFVFSIRVRVYRLTQWMEPISFRALTLFFDLSSFSTHKSHDIHFIRKFLLFFQFNRTYLLVFKICLQTRCPRWKGLVKKSDMFSEFTTNFYRIISVVSINFTHFPCVEFILFFFPFEIFVSLKLYIFDQLHSEPLTWKAMNFVFEGQCKKKHRQLIWFMLKLIKCHWPWQFITVFFFIKEKKIRNVNISNESERSVYVYGNTWSGKNEK